MARKRTRNPGSTSQWEAALLTYADSDTIEDAAKALSTRLLGQTWTLPTPIEILAQNLEAKIVFADLQHSGFVTATPSGGYIITINSQHSSHRRRFTVAHEIGHILLDKAARQVLGLKPLTRQSRSCQRTNRMERACDILARELLVPSEVLRSFITNLSIEQPVAELELSTILHVSRHFAVSTVMAAKRVAEINCWHGSFVAWEASIRYEKNLVKSWESPPRFLKGFGGKRDCDYLIGTDGPTWRTLQTGQLEVGLDSVDAVTTSIHHHMGILNLHSLRIYNKPTPVVLSYVHGFALDTPKHRDTQ